MTISEFATKLQSRMPEGVQIERVENHAGVLRGLVLLGGQVKEFAVLLDSPPSDLLVERVSERIKVALQ